jgi:hypothetical protein
MSIVRKNDIMGFYASKIVNGTDLIHAEFMDRERMNYLLNKYDCKNAKVIKDHLLKHDLKSTKERIKLIKIEKHEIK